MIPRHRVVAAAVVLFLSAARVAADPAPPRETRVRTERFDGWTRTEVVVPGILVSYALPRNPDGSREIVLLVEPRRGIDVSERSGDDETDDMTERLPACPSDETVADRTLVRVSLDPGEKPRRIREGLARDLETLDAADLNGDGADELLLARERELLVVEPGGERRVLEDPGLVWSSLHPRATEQPELDGRPLVPTTPLGELLLFGPGEDGPGEDGAGEDGAGEDGAVWRRLAAVEIPVLGQVSENDLLVYNPRPGFVGTRGDGTLLFATRPEPHGNQRLQTLRIEIGPSGNAEVTDCWSRLPEPEEVLEEHFLVLDGEAMLFVTTKPADKLALFGEKRLRLFSLQRDRSRLGKPPVYAAESRANLWQEITPFLLDVNGDDRKDLVLGYWKGLKDDRVVLDVYPRDAEGRFARSARTTAFDVKLAKRRRTPDSKPGRPEPDRSFVQYGRDLDGDSLPDLLLRTPVSLILFRGRPTTDGERLVDGKPLELPLADESGAGGAGVTVGTKRIGFRFTIQPGRPRLADLDGDGTAEILVVARGQAAGDDLLQILSIRP